MDLKSIIESVNDIILIEGEEVFSIFNKKESTMIMLYNMDDYEYVIRKLKEKNVKIVSRKYYLDNYYG
jgi:hypothetical protein